MATDRSTAGAALCGSAMVVLGASVVVTGSLLDYPHATGQALRYGLAAIVLTAAMAALPSLRQRTQIRVTTRQWALLTATAASGLAAFNMFLLAALGQAEPAAVATVVGCAPLLLALLAPLTRRQNPSAQLVLAAAIVVGGTALVHGAGHSTPTGVAAAGGALLGDVVFSILAARLSEDLGAVRVAAYSCALAVPLLVAVALATGETRHWRWPDATELAAIGFLGLVLTSLAFVAWFQGLVLLGVERGGMLVGLVPVATLAVVALQHTALPPATQILGVTAVSIGLVVGLRQAPGQLRPGLTTSPVPRAITWAMGTAAGLALMTALVTGL